VAAVLAVRGRGRAGLAGPGGAVCRLAAVLRNRLKSIQYRPELIGGFLAQTGLTLEPQPP
jgi:putative transposase